tara:strand:- start:1263 stop:1625 length:363 start_codon:yes stop_codon:yes gene_type:complete
MKNDRLDGVFRLRAYHAPRRESWVAALTKGWWWVVLLDMEQLPQEAQVQREYTQPLKCTLRGAECFGSEGEALDAAQEALDGYRGLLGATSGSGPNGETGDAGKPSYRIYRPDPEGDPGK